MIEGTLRIDRRNACGSSSYVKALFIHKRPEVKKATPH